MVTSQPANYNTPAAEIEFAKVYWHYLSQYPYCLWYRFCL